MYGTINTIKGRVLLLSLKRYLRILGKQADADQMGKSHGKDGRRYERVRNKRKSPVEDIMKYDVYLYDKDEKESEKVKSEVSRESAVRDVLYYKSECIPAYFQTVKSSC